MTLPITAVSNSCTTYCNALSQNLHQPEFRARIQKQLDKLQFTRLLCPVLIFNHYYPRKSFLLHKILFNNFNTQLLVYISIINKNAYSFNRLTIIGFIIILFCFCEVAKHFVGHSKIKV